MIAFQPFLPLYLIALMEKPGQIVGVVSAIGEIAALLNRVPWANAYATLICGIVCAIILSFVLARIGLRILAGVMVFFGLSFAAILIAFLVCNPPDPEGRPIGASFARQKALVPGANQNQLEEQIIVPLTMNADAVMIVFSAPRDEARIERLNAEPLGKGNPLPINIETPGPKDDAVQYQGIKKDSTVRVKVTLGLRDRLPRDSIELIADVRYFNRPLFWYIFRWLYIYYG